MQIEFLRLRLFLNASILAPTAVKMSYIYRSDALVLQEKAWKKVIGVYNCHSLSLSLLASSCGTTMADFIGPYGEHALNAFLHDMGCMLSDSL